VSANSSGAEKRLFALWRGLGEGDRKTLLDLAEFLSARDVRDPLPIPAPALSPRPEQESVVKAIKRLTAGYHMMDVSSLLSATSALMAQHVMQGKPAKEVIDELERLFKEHYQRLLASSGRTDESSSG
jgi:hypothetical protein